MSLLEFMGQHPILTFFLAGIIGKVIIETASIVFRDGKDGANSNAQRLEQRIKSLRKTLTHYANGKARDGKYAQLALKEDDEAKEK